MLENEVVAKTALAEEVQRLKDELRGTNAQECRLTVAFCACCRSVSGDEWRICQRRTDHSPSFVFVVYRYKCGAGSDEVESGNIEWLDS